MNAAAERVRSGTLRRGPLCQHGTRLLSPFVAVLLAAAAATAQTPAEATLDSLRAARASHVAAGDADGVAATTNAIGLHFLRSGSVDSALAYQHHVWALRSAQGDTSAAARAHNTIGVIYYQSAQYEDALEHFLHALELWRELGDSAGTALALNNVGKTYQDWGQQARAFAAFEDALVIAESRSNARLLGYTLNNLGVLQRQLGRRDTARALFERSLALYTGPPDPDIDDPASGVSLNTSELGLLAALDGDYERAHALLTADLRAAVAVGLPRREARALDYLGRTYQRQGNLQAAREHFERSLAIAVAIGQRAPANHTRAALADVADALGDPRAALAYMRAHNAARDSIFDQAAGLRVAAMEARNDAARTERENAQLRLRQQVNEAIIARQWLAFGLGGALLLVSAAFGAVLVRANRQRQRRNDELGRANAAIEETNRQLQSALAEVRTLSGFIPICASCKNVRDDRGYWENVETYISNRSDATFSHGICSACGPDLYGDDWPEPESAPNPDGRATPLTGAADGGR